MLNERLIELHVCHVGRTVHWLNVNAAKSDAIADPADAAAIVLRRPANDWRCKSVRNHLSLIYRRFKPELNYRLVEVLSAKLNFSMSGSNLSPLTREALRLLAASIKTQRLRRHWSIAELARRVGVSHPTIIKIERANPTVAIGTVLEAATLVGVAMFDADPLVRARHQQRLDAELKLLPRAGRMATAEADDDF